MRATRGSYAAIRIPAPPLTAAEANNRLSTLRGTIERLSARSLREFIELSTSSVSLASYSRSIIKEGSRGETREVVYSTRYGLQSEIGRSLYRLRRYVQLGSCRVDAPAGAPQKDRSFDLGNASEHRLLQVRNRHYNAYLERRHNRHPRFRVYVAASAGDTGATLGEVSIPRLLLSFQLYRFRTLSIRPVRNAIRSTVSESFPFGRFRKLPVRLV